MPKTTREVGFGQWGASMLSFISGHKYIHLVYANAPIILLLLGFLCIIPSALKSNKQPKILSAFDSEHTSTYPHHNTKKTMATIVTSKKELKTAIKESVREVLDQEFMKMRAVLLPFVSEKEQKDIERLYGKPSRKVTKSRKLEI